MWTWASSGLGWAEVRLNCWLKSGERGAVGVMQGLVSGVKCKNQ